MKPICGGLLTSLCSGVSHRRPGYRARKKREGRDPARFFHGVFAYSSFLLVLIMSSSCPKISGSVTSSTSAVTSEGTEFWEKVGLLLICIMA